MTRKAIVERRTRETHVRVEIDLDGSGQSRISTPIPFLSHMVDQLARHGLFDLDVLAEGDVDIDGHHTTEDLGLVLGSALAEALGDRKRIRRFGSATVPMDDARASVSIDISGRSYLVIQGELPRAKLGEWDTELVEVFFDAVARAARINLHVVLEAGHNLHHQVEVCFKALARALRTAVEQDPRVDGIPSTKGHLD